MTINCDLNDLLSGMIYKNLFFQEMYSIVGHSRGIETTLKGKPYAQQQMGYRLNIRIIIIVIIIFINYKKQITGI